MIENSSIYTQEDIKKKSVFLNFLQEVILKLKTNITIQGEQHYNIPRSLDQQVDVFKTLDTV